MVVRSELPERADRLFHALADATRRDIVTRCMRREHSVSDLARAYPMSFAAVQKHVAVLERAELVTKRRHGREQLVRGNVAAVRRTHEQLDAMEAAWLDRLDRFADVLADDLARHPVPPSDDVPSPDPAPSTEPSTRRSTT
jgi:DNA-binding transcriptional ArsR family regulator